MSALVDELRRLAEVKRDNQLPLDVRVWAHDQLECLCQEHADAILRVLEAAEGVADGDRPENALLPAVAALREVKP